MIVSNVVCIGFKIIVNRNLRLKGYVSRMMEKWWCLHPLWRGRVWTGYSFTEGASGGGQAASWTPGRQVSIAVRDWGEKSKCHKFSDQPRSSQGFPGGSDCKVCLRCGRPRLDPWRRKWQPTPVLLPGKSHGWRILAVYSPWGCKELDMTEWLHFISLRAESVMQSDIVGFAIKTHKSLEFSLTISTNERLFL